MTLWCGDYGEYVKVNADYFFLYLFFLFFFLYFRTSVHYYFISHPMRSLLKIIFVMVLLCSFIEFLLQMSLTCALGPIQKARKTNVDIYGHRLDFRILMEC
jgi:hypothetical protein